MPWCPVCKNEYKEGYTVCSDCGATLVDSLDSLLIPIYFGEEDVLADMNSFIKANADFPTDVSYDEESSQWILSVPEDDKDSCMSLIKIYLAQLLKKQNAEEGISEEDFEEELPEREMPKIYVEPEKRAEEYKSGAYVLTVVGILGIIAIVLVDIGVIPINLAGSSKILINVVMGVMFAVFTFLGINSFSVYKNLLKESVLENNLKDKVFELVLSKGKDYYCSGDEEGAEEGNYFKRSDLIGEVIDSAYPDLEENLKNHIVEEAYTKLFE